MARLPCIEGFFTDAVVRHLAPCISCCLTCCVRVVIMSCFLVRPMCAGGCAIHVAGFDVMFVCRRSVFEELQQRGPKCVCDRDELRFMARLRSSNPNAFPPPGSLHVLHPLPRHVFSLSHTALVFSTEHLFLRRPGYVTRIRLFFF